MIKNKDIQKIINISLIFLLVFLIYPRPASAGALSGISDTLSRLKAGSTANHTIVFTTPTGIANTNTVTLTFPSSSFTMGGSLSGVTIADDSGADNAVTSAIWSDPTLTITASSSSTVAAGHTATIKIPSEQITNPTAAATYIISIGGTFGDTGSFAVVITSDDSIVYSATVDPTITVTYSGFSSSFSSALSVSSVTSTSAITVTTSSNAQNGVTLTVYDAGDGSNPGLYKSASPIDLIGSANAAYGDTATLLAGTEGYGIQAATNGNGTGGTLTIGARYNQSGNTVGGLEVGADMAQTLATSSVPINQRETVLTAKAAIDGLNRAGSYQDTVTVIATGNF